ncbi:hypothetical protein DRE_04843 [Drechslerella stenobrocha 248]|uniref:Inositol-pentakisphosphate 2-kinase n=1 Tax=Drechslerella stenobrocha 248 TaxID=1043628 RepID=W7HP12_9PEZI|nr:hypothetical protein DRE_04843 [Drechslerella stenobrocha 248]
MSTVQPARPHTDTQTFILPSNLTLKYVAEGAANVIWRISLPQEGPRTPPPTSIEEYSGTTPPPSETGVEKEIPADNNIGGAVETDDANNHATVTLVRSFSDVLLRLRKCLPSSESNVLAYKYLASVIMPLFPAGVMVGQTLVQVPPTLVSRANDILHRLEESGARPAHRRHLYLAGDPRPSTQQMNEPYAFLVEDMTPDVSRGEFLLEFKAKWLVQSRSAPDGWKRCRTCALRLRRSAEALEKGNSAKWRGLCPFDLISGDVDRVTTAASHILEYPRNEDKNLVRRVTEALMGYPQLSILKELQASLDQNGILKADLQSEEFLTAMTLRDCTFYMKVSPLNIQARLGDFDVKSGEGGKSDYWIATERMLLDEGWYSGTEKGDFPWKVKGMEVVCRG